MSTLLDFATTDLSNTKQDVTAAQSAVAATQQAITQNASDRDTNALAIAKAQADVAAAKTALASAAMPADATAAAAQLQTALDELNTAQSDAIRLQVQLDTLNGELTVQTGALGAVTTDLTTAQTSFATAQQKDLAHQTWHAAIGGTLAGISQAAADAKTKSPYTDAKANAEAGFDTTLLKHVRKRESNEQARLSTIESTRDAMQDDLDTKLKTDRGVPGAVAEKQTAYDRAEAAFGDAVTGAQDRFNRALGLLATVASAPKLTPAETDAMTDATLVTAAKGDPVAHEEDVEAKADALTAAQAALETAQAQTAAGWDPAPDVAAATTAVGTAQDDLDTAQAAFTDADKEALAAWTATVPDARWSLLAAFDEADLILSDLIANATPTKLGQLENTMADAAGDLVDALTAEAESDRAIAALQERVDLQTAVLAAAQRNGAAQVLNALSGNA